MTHLIVVQRKGGDTSRTPISDHIAPEIGSEMYVMLDADAVAVRILKHRHVTAMGQELDIVDALEI